MHAPADTGPSRGLIVLLAAACGAIVANIYYAQPLIGPIAASLHLSVGAAGLIVTLTQLGYAAGLLLIVPAADLVENRALTLGILAVAAVALAAAALAGTTSVFFGACLLIGLGSVAVQVLVPYGAHLAPEARRGQVVGTVMSGLMAGIMLSRPVASVVTYLAGWHLVFAGSAVVTIAVGVVLRLRMPPRQPRAVKGGGVVADYLTLLGSMGRLALTTRVLQRRTAYHACLFGAFSLFWTVAPLLLARRFSWSQMQIALFTLVAAAGTFAAPVAGRMADRGWTLVGTRLAMGGAVVAFGCAFLSGRVGEVAAIALLLGAAALLDVCVVSNLVLGQRAIFMLPADIRSRLNGLYMAGFFAGGAAGSACGAFVYERGGWAAACAVGAALAVIGGGLALTEGR
jgi:predicted MFS family arabinose efflux permease